MNFDEYVDRGIAFSKEKKYKQAFESFEAALNIQPDNAQVRSFAEKMKKMIDIESSRKQMAKNEAIERVKIFETWWGRKDYDNAIEEYTQALNLNPEATVQSIFVGIGGENSPVKDILADAYYIRGLMFVSEGEDARAIEAYNEAIKFKLDYLFAIKQRAYASSRICDYDQAIKDFERMIQIEPDNAEWKKCLAKAYIDHGMAYVDKNEYKPAIDDLNMALGLNDDSNTRELLEMVKARMVKTEAKDSSAKVETAERAEQEERAAREKADQWAREMKEKAEREAREAAEKARQKAWEAAEKAAGKRKAAIGIILQLLVTAAAFIFFFSYIFNILIPNFKLKDDIAFSDFFQLVLRVGIPTLAIGIISLIFRRNSGSIVGFVLIFLIVIVSSVTIVVNVAKGFWGFIGWLIVFTIIFIIIAIPGLVMVGRESELR